MPNARNSGSRALLQQTKWVTCCARPLPIKPHIMFYINHQSKDHAFDSLKNKNWQRRRRKGKTYHCPEKNWRAFSISFCLRPAIELAKINNQKTQTIAVVIRG